MRSKKWLLASACQAFKSAPVKVVWEGVTYNGTANYYPGADVGWVVFPQTQYTLGTLFELYDVPWVRMAGVLLKGMLRVRKTDKVAVMVPVISKGKVTHVQKN